MKALYTAAATAQGGRDGHVRSADGILDMDLRTPKEMGGPGGAATNPEQLFAAGYAACFESAVRVVARMQKRSRIEGERPPHPSGVTYAAVIPPSTRNVAPVVNDDSSDAR
jgi:organic hydroperoxide reductase OsmC/OhrA